MNFRPLSCAAFTLLLSATAFAHDYHAGDVYVDHPYARATVAGQTSGAVYLTLENKGKQSDALISAQSPAAKSVEIHTMSMSADHVMRMREVSGIELKPQEKVVMLPGNGYHIMLTGLKTPLKTGDKFPLTLTFRQAGKIETSIWVEDGKKKDAGASHDEHQHH